MPCPDGYGEILVVNLDARAGKAWRFDIRRGGLTLFPSVWRDGGCGSHFIVWRGHILWCDRFERDNIEPDYDAAIEELVLAAMDVETARSAVQLADAIDELVWTRTARPIDWSDAEPPSRGRLRANGCSPA